MAPMAKKALAPSNVTTRDSKGRKFISIVESAYNKAGLSEEEAQRVNDKSGLAELIGNFISENRANNKFKDEETSSNYGYLSGYKSKGEDLDRQIEVIQKLFPGLGGANSDYLNKVKSGQVKVGQIGEKFFAVPNIWKSGGLAIFGSAYSQALQAVLDKIKETRNGKFYNYREDEIDEKHIRQTSRTIKAFRELSVAQDNPDILIVSAQFGIRHRGRSVRRAREVFASSEFGIGAFAIGIMLLTHPERLQNCNDLLIDCAGDDFFDKVGGVFDTSPFLSFRNDEVEFGARYVDYTGRRCGSASAFLPQ